MTRISYQPKGAPFGKQVVYTDLEKGVAIFTISEGHKPVTKSPCCEFSFTTLS